MLAWRGVPASSPAEGAASSGKLFRILDWSRDRMESGSDGVGWIAVARCGVAWSGVDSSMVESSFGWRLVGVEIAK